MVPNPGSLKSKSIGSPDWATDLLLWSSQRAQHFAARALENLPSLRHVLVILIGFFGIWLMLSWPEQRAHIDRRFFLQFGFGFKLVYYMVGASGLFIAVGSVKFLLPQNLWRSEFNALTFFFGGVVAAAHADMTAFEMIYTVLGVVGPFAAMAARLTWKQTTTVLFGLFSVSLLYSVMRLLSGTTVEQLGTFDRSIFLMELGLVPTLLASWLIARSPKKSSWIFFVSLFAVTLSSVLMSLAYRWGLLNETVWILTPARYAMVGIFALISYATLETHRTQKTFRALFLPTHWVGQVPFRPESLSQERTSAALYVRGLWQYGVCVFLVFACSILEKLTPIASLRFPFYGCAVYLQFFFMSWLTFMIPVAGASIMGYSVPDPFVHPLLASNPGDRWRRWNTYYYEWFRTVIFIPFFRYTNSLAGAVYVTFLMTWLIHINPFVVKPAEFVKGGGMALVAAKLLFFMLHATAVYIGLKFPRLFPRSDRKRGWIGVLLVFLIMGLIHHFGTGPLVFDSESGKTLLDHAN